MQKKVLAAVIGGLLAAPAAFADNANVTISGRIAVGWESYKLAGGNPAPAGGYHNEYRVSDQSSSLVFSGSEDIGGGLKGVFQIDNRFSPDGSAATSFGATGNTWLGLAGGFGRIVLGRNDVHYNEANVLGGLGKSSSLQSWLSPGPFSQVNGTTVGVGSRTPNLIMWDSNNMGGVTARVAYSTNPAGNEGSGRGGDGSADGAWTAALRWSSGPLTVGGSYWDSKTEGKPTGATNNQLGDLKGLKLFAGWNLGAATVGLGYDNSEARVATNESMTKRTAWLVPVTFKATNDDTIVASFAKMGKLSGPNGSCGAACTTDSTDATAYGVGWDHALSKRTSVGAYYTKIDNKTNAKYNMFAIAASGATAVAAGEDPTQLYLGITHTY